MTSGLTYLQHSKTAENVEFREKPKRKEEERRKKAAPSDFLHFGKWSHLAALYKLALASSFGPFALRGDTKPN